MTRDLSLLSHDLELVRRLFLSAENLCSWTYDAGLQLLGTNSDDPLLHTVFAYTGCLNAMAEYGLRQTKPLILTAPPGLMWAAVFERREDAFFRAHVIGPAVHVDISRGAIDAALRSCSIPLSWKGRFAEKLQTLPVISNSSFLPYAVMLHLCVTGEAIQRGDVQYQQSGTLPPDGEAMSRRKDRHKVWMAEQALLRMVREGNLRYQTVLNQSAALSNGVQVNVGDPLAQARLSAVSFITLCVRAAIEGGLSPEFAYSKGDAYLQSAILCKTISDVASLNHAMYGDFVRCVHDCRTNPDVSPPVQSCCDYIELHVDEPLSIGLLAGRLGYTEYYLSRKFKREMRVSVGDYIKCARVEHAKLLLTSSTASVQEISDKLHFCTRSYFSEVFRSITGMTPAEFRKKTQRL